MFVRMYVYVNTIMYTCKITVQLSIYDNNTTLTYLHIITRSAPSSPFNSDKMLTLAKAEQALENTPDNAGTYISYINKYIYVFLCICVCKFIYILRCVCLYLYIYAYKMKCYTLVKAEQALENTPDNAGRLLDRYLWICICLYVNKYIYIFVYIFVNIYMFISVPICVFNME
jgi:hypothetical protein